MSGNGAGATRTTTTYLPTFSRRRPGSICKGAKEGVKDK